jgi:O-antigen/teichoic acid export membrane protein
LRSLSDRAALLIIANAFKYAVGFVLPMILVRHLSQADYGTYQQLNLIANLGTGVLVLGLPMSIYYFYHHFHRPTLIAQTQIILLASGVLAAGALALAAPLLAARMHNAQLGELLPAYGLYVGLYIAGEHFMHVMISQNRYRMAVGLEVAETSFRVAALTVLLLLGYALHALVMALVLYAALRLAGRSYWLWTGADSVRGSSWRQRFASAQLAYSLPLAASACVGLIGGLLDKAIVALVFLPADYAIYSVGALEIPLDTIFQGSVANVLRASLPSLIRERRIDEVVRIWRDSVRKLALIMIPSFVFFTCFADSLITTLFTRHYEASVQIFRIYLLVLPLYMFILNATPQVFGKTRLNLYVAGASVASNVVLSLILLPLIGILGPATAFVVSSYLTSALYFVVTRRLLETPSIELLPLKSMGRTLLASGLAIVPAAVVSALLPEPWSLLAGAAVFGLAYLPAGFVTRAFHPADIEMARSWLRRLGLGSS